MPSHPVVVSAAASALVAPGQGEVVWLVWLRTWVETSDGRRIVPQLLAVCSSVTIALDLMVRGGDSTWAEPVTMDCLLPGPPPRPAVTA